jgi:hypothetical protein
MELKKWDDLVSYVQTLLIKGNAVFIGVHGVNLVDTLVQFTGYFCHAQYISHIVTDIKDPSGLPVGSIASVCADGTSVKWYDFISQYQSAVKAGTNEITIGYFPCTPDDLAKIDGAIIKTVGDKYSMENNFWDAGYTIAGWFKGVGTLISALMTKWNPWASDHTENCSEDCSIGMRAVRPGFCPGLDVDCITPTDFMGAPEILKDVKSDKG